MVQISLELLRKKAEHNRGDLATLEEVSLHQLEIESINVALGNLTKRLKILYLQNNLIPRIENLHKLRGLEYLNLALNNVQKIEGLSSCECLQKLDLTVNFVGIQSLEESVEHLKPLDRLSLLYLTGNPCTEFDGYRQFVVASLPQLSSLDGQEITRSERLRAIQVLPEVTTRLRAAAAEAAARQQVEGAQSEPDPELFTPEGRLLAHRRAVEEKERAEKEEAAKKAEAEAVADPWRAAQKELAAKVEPPADGSMPRQRNIGKTEFTMKVEDGKQIVVDVAVPRFLDTSLIDVDVHPGWAQVVFKANNLLFHFPAEVCPDKGRVQRLAHNGHLRIMVPLVAEQPELVAAPAAGTADGPRKPRLPADAGRVKYTQTAANSKTPAAAKSGVLNEHIEGLLEGLGGIRELSAKRSESLLARQRAEREAAEAKQLAAANELAGGEVDTSELPPLE